MQAAEKDLRWISAAFVIRVPDGQAEITSRKRSARHAGCRGLGNIPGRRLLRRLIRQRGLGDLFQNRNHPERTALRACRRFALSLFAFHGDETI
jgi:hypothetical protein